VGYRLRVRIASLAVAIATALSLGAAPLSAASTGSEVVGHAQERSPAAVIDYWTPERMREAIPLAGPEQAAALVNGAEAADFRAAPTDQETFPGADTLYPQRIHGILFLTIGGQSASCSATVVTSFSHDVILTAGHCLANPGPALGQTTFSQNVAFVPGYRDMARPFGTYPATSLRTPGIWAVEGVISFDFGAVKLASPTGVPIQDQLGSRGVSFNRPSFNGQVFGIFGYPAQPSEFYNGERLIFCSSPFLGFEQGTGGIMAGPCRQQQGSSGGGWVSGNGLVNSVVSHGGCPVPSTLCTTTVGTYLGDLAFETYAAAAGGIPGKLRKRIKNCIKKNKKFKKEQRCLNKIETFQPVAL
jgi:V8-like Glu-specific endopeptidase